MKKLLIVDDDADILESMNFMFTSFGFESEGTQRGDEVYQMASTYQPDLIILDYLLSGTYGTDICRDLKTAPDTRHIPIIMFSAHPKAGDLIASCGAEDFIAKPFMISDLMEKVKRLIGEV